MAKKTNKKVTEAGKVELDENDLDNVQGGATYNFEFKISDANTIGTSKDFLKIGDNKLTTDYLKFGDIAGESTKR